MLDRHEKDEEGKKYLTQQTAKGKGRQKVSKVREAGKKEIQVHHNETSNEGERR